MGSNEINSTDRITAEINHLRAMSVIFLNDQRMDEPLRFWEADFRDPRLRRCIFDPETIIFESRIGGGDDGYVWKVKFGDEGPFALKVFWDQVPPIKTGAYYSMQRECQNAAVLQMMEAAVTNKPVLVNVRPGTKQVAMDNYFSFSENYTPKYIRDITVEVTEVFAEEITEEITEESPCTGTKLISSLPRMTKCHGWLKLPTDVWRDLPDHLQALHEEVSKTRTLVENHLGCIAVIYELIEEGENEPNTVEEVDTFLWHAGFAYAVEPRARNWKSGVLVDYTEIVHTRGYGWNVEDYIDRTAESILTE